jgi:drug/metabolite transporter (DMT)-like permease
MPSLQILGPLAAFSASVTWALGSSIYSKLADHYPAYVINTTRASVGFLLFLITICGLLFFGHASVSANIPREQILWLMISMFASYGFGDVLFFMSAQRVGVPVALTIASSYPLWAAFAGVIFRGEQLSQAQMLGLLTIVVGVSIVILGDGREQLRKNSTSKNNHIFGILLGLGTSLLWSLNSFSVSRGSQGLDPIFASGLRMAMATMLCPVIGICMGFDLRRAIWVRFIDFKKYWWVFVLESFGGTFFYVFGFAHSSIAVASALSSLAPVLSVPIAYLVMRTKVTWQKMLGIALVSVGVSFLVFRA